MANIFSKEDLLPENVALVVHHPMYILKAGEKLRVKMYLQALEYIIRMRELGVLIVYFAYPYNFDTLMLNNCDFCVFQTRGKSSRITWKHFVQTLIEDKMIDSSEIRKLRGGKKPATIKPKKIKRKVEKRLKDGKGAIVYSHEEAGIVIADLLDKKRGSDLKTVYLIGGPVEGCLPINVEYLNRVLEKRGVDFRMIGELVTREYPESKKYKSPAGNYCSRCRQPLSKCICRNKEIAENFKVDTKKIRGVWQTHFSKFDAEEIYQILKENLEEKETG